MSTSGKELEEYECQLLEVNELIAADPDDGSLFKLKEDLEELISITRSDLADAKLGSKTEQIEVSGGKEGIPAQKSPANAETGMEPAYENMENTLSSLVEAQPLQSETAESKKQPKTKLSKKTPTKFEIPEHLFPLDTDTERERNSKRRTLKALKSKWRERVKEAAGLERQKSWQSFICSGSSTKKKGKKRALNNPNDSIFRTNDGVHAKVGVIGSGKGMTEFGERKRFKSTT